MSLPRTAITGGVLAGGAGRRMGGLDKGWVALAGRPLIHWVLDALRPQVGTLLINANRHPADYAALGLPVIADTLPDFAGPLAGIAALLAACRSEALLVVPCDGPRLPPQLAERLSAALQAADADLAYAVAAGRRQPLHALLRPRLLPALTAALADGERKPDRWYAGQRHVEVSFDEAPEMFENLNTPEARAAFEAALSAGALP